MKIALPIFMGAATVALILGLTMALYQSFKPELTYKMAFAIVLVCFWVGYHVYDHFRMALKRN